MKKAEARVFPPKQSSVLQAMQGQPNGVGQLSIPSHKICAFLDHVGEENVIGLTAVGPMVIVWYWRLVEVADERDPS